MTPRVPQILMCLACAAALPARAQQAEQEPETQSARYLLGASLASRPEYDGAASRKTQLKPLWAVQWGRWRISTSGGSALLGFGREGVGAGASTLLVDNTRLRVGLALRMDSGRSSGDATTTQGLPDVKRTLRARLSASLNLAPDWTLSGNLSQDLLGRGGGLTAGADVGWRFYRSPTVEWAAGAGVSAGNAQNLRSYFGVPESAVAASGKPAYEPGAGLRDLHAGVSFTRPLSKHWFMFGGAGASRLLGPAADSPLVQQRDGQYANLGVAWRN
ncbi:MipA/OmpV family protein [Roseateles sp. BYS87W]|uniref:MipA/OmpV family protein n=1 Tax=Pelomonas baiyunensis TaxID=3299026 RepID=A0ABW7H4G3_9BURK